MSPDSSWYSVLDALADAVNPCLTVLALSVPFLRPLRHQRRLAITYVAMTAIGILGIYAVAAVDGWLRLWARTAGDYSTHTAFAASLVISMLFWKPTWAKPLTAALLAYLMLILVLGYHSPADVVTSAVAAWRRRFRDRFWCGVRADAYADSIISCGTSKLDQTFWVSSWSSRTSSKRMTCFDLASSRAT